MKQERFGSRIGMMLAMLGMAVGTGNIWRFPRIAAKNGGGEFLVAWIAFLLLWSIPLILLEFGMGRRTRSGPVRSFVDFMGPRRAWMGAFCVLVAAGIMCYYSVVAGWTARYALASILGEIPESAPGAFWTRFTASAWPIVPHALMIGLAAFVVARGARAIERAALVLMPALLVLLGILVVRAVTLPGASDGLSYLFSVDWSQLSRARIWIEALTQNAWDTGAGWGLVLCYAAYQREREDTALNAFILPSANNLISLMAGVMVLCTVFSVVPPLIEQAADNPESLRGLGSLEDAVSAGTPFSAQLMQQTIFSEDNAGITFIWMPQLFRSLAFGRFFMAVFFLALAVAAFTSLTAMVEVVTRALTDSGMTRRTAVQTTAAGGFLLGLPSALSLKILENQDWVWSMALTLSGLFFAAAVIAKGVRSFRNAYLNHEHSDIAIGSWWDFTISTLVPAEAIGLFLWLLYQAWRDDPEGWLHPFNPENVFNVGTVLFQLGIVLAALLIFNRRIAASVSRS